MASKPKIFEKASLCVIDLGIEDFVVKFENESEQLLYLIMASIDTIPPPLVRLESQPDNLMGSSDVAEVSNFLPAHMNGQQDEAKIPASNGLESHQVFTTGLEKNAVIPPLLPESRKDNKSVPWYDSNCHSSFVQS